MDRNTEMKHALCELDERILPALRLAIDGLPTEMRAVQLQQFERDVNQAKQLFTEWLSKLSVHTLAIQSKIAEKGGK